MADKDHPRGPLDLIRRQRGGYWPMHGQQRKRYGKIGVWPIDILWWVQTVQPSRNAVQIETGIWVELEISDQTAPPQNPVADAALGDRADSVPADFPRLVF